MEDTRKFTRNLMSKFPSWMKIAKDPDSVGARFLDVFGLSFEEVEKELNQTVHDFYIETADADMVDLLYRVPLTQDVVTDFEPTTDRHPEVYLRHHDGSIEQVGMVERVRHFYKRDASLPLGLVDRTDGFLYLRVDLNTLDDLDEPFQYIEINDARHYSIDYHHVWNAFDEFGYLLGLNRLPLERNDDFKNRILDVFKHPGNSTHEGIENGLARELGLERGDIDVFKLNESMYDKELVNPDGSPTKKMREYAKNINDNLRFTIDNLNLGDAYWQSLEEDNLGIEFLPHIWDIDDSLFDSDEFQSGVGFGDDLKVSKPKTDDSTHRDFQLNVSLVGYYEDFEEFYPEVEFEYKIYAQGKLLENNYEEEPFRYTTTAAETFEQDYTVTASQDFRYLHEVLFDTPDAFIDTDGTPFIHFGESNDFLNDQTDTLQRLSLYLSTGHELQSNQMSDLRIYWLDTDGKEHHYTFDSREKWLNPQVNHAGQPTSTIATSGTYYNTGEDGLELGRGNFQETITTSSDFMRGRYDTNFTLVENGSLTLNLDSTDQLMN